MKIIYYLIIPLGVVLLLSVGIYYLSPQLDLSKINQESFQGILTFLSIIMGFNITALSLIANSIFASILYRKESPNDNSKTLLHELLNKFKYSFFLCLSGITLIILFPYISNICGIKVCYKWIQFDTGSLMTALVLILTFSSICSFIQMLDKLMYFIIQNAKRIP